MERPSAFVMIISTSQNDFLIPFNYWIPSDTARWNKLYLDDEN